MTTFASKEVVETYYKIATKRIQNLQKKIKNRGLTLSEKILYSHFYQQEVKEFRKGQDDLELAPDRVCMQDATAQMAILQFVSVGIPKVETPTSVHCDHLIRAKEGACKDLASAKVTNKEVYDFLGSSAKKYGMDFWEPGSGIIHQII